MIVTLVLFGAICIFGVFVVMVFVSAVSGNIVGLKVHQRQNAKSVRLTSNVVKPLPVPKVEKYFIEIGQNRIPIDASEVKDAKNKGYKVLRE